MISRIRQKLGPAGFIVAIVALVAALAGGAYAASGALTGKQKKEVEKIAKKFAGVPGATGPAGAAGAAGKDGASGKAGANGKDGANGKSVEFGAAPTPEECEFGGVTVVAGEPPSKKPVCNGETGYSAELPPEATETGTWWFEGNNEEIAGAPISFPIPLSVADAAAITVNVWRESKPTKPAACLGTPDAPEAEAGALCLYVPTAAESVGFAITAGQVFKPSLAEPGVGTSGALLRTDGFISAEKHMGGSFAITAPAP